MLRPDGGFLEKVFGPRNKSKAAKQPMTGRLFGMRKKSENRPSFFGAMKGRIGSRSGSMKRVAAPETKAPAPKVSLPEPSMAPERSKAGGAMRRMSKVGRSY